MANVRVQEIELTNREGADLASLARQVQNSLDEYCQNSTGWIQIFCGFRTPNGERTDNDIVIFGSLNNLVINTENRRVRIGTFAAVLECKAHSSVNRDLFFEGNDIKVKYKNRRSGNITFSSVCVQADECARSIKSEVNSQIRVSPYVESFSWLYNFNGSRPQPYAFASKFEALEFFGDLARSAVTKKATKRCVIQNGEVLVFQATGLNRSGQFNDEKLREYALSRTLRNLNLDDGALTRARVERITKASLNKVNLSNYFSEIGQKMLAFIGGPGTGKTARLLYSAKWLAEEGYRILLLTYNHVLKCDLKRLIYYAGLSSLEDFGVNPKSSTLFFTDILVASGLIMKTEIDENFFESRYIHKLEELLSIIKDGPCQDTEEKIFLYANYDYVMIDEAQDWPIVERDLILALWGSEKVILASSPDQLTRGGLQSNDWTRLARSGVNRPSHRKCLRQARMLVQFNKLFLQKLNYEPLLYEADEELGGGKIVLCEGEYTPALHYKILDCCNLLQHERYDICLACHQNLGSKKDGFYKRHDFYRAGFPLWDACDQQIRRSYPIGDDLQRVMFYESSRGIEAWAFVLMEFDVWLRDIIPDRAAEEYESEARQLSLEGLSAQGEIESKMISIQKQISRWALIPLSRAVSVNIINVSDLETKYGALILDTLKCLPEQCYEVIPRANH
jgi:hypothetical protein